MIDSILKKLSAARKSKRSMALYVGIVIIGLVVAGVLLFHGNNQDKSRTAGTSITANQTQAENTTDTAGNPVERASASSTGTAVKPSAAKAANPSSVPTPTVGKPTTAVVKTTTNSDGTVSKQIATYKAVSFSSQTQNDANLKRGATQQLQAGQDGIETIMYEVTYDHDGKELSRKLLSDSVTKQAVNQITRVGTSDYNFNVDTWNGTEYGMTCLPSEYNAAGADGCLGAANARYFSAVNLSGNYYVYCVSVASDTCNSPDTANLRPVAVIRGDGAFTYAGATYRADPRRGGGETQLLTPTLCSQYGLACGSW
jgi:hypothetical protein